MAQRVFQTALSLLLIGAILCSFSQQAQKRKEFTGERVLSASSLNPDLASALATDESENPFSFPSHWAPGLEWDLEEETESKKRTAPEHGFLVNGEQLVHLINGPPARPSIHFASQVQHLPLFLLFEVFRL